MVKMNRNYTFMQQINKLGRSRHVAHYSLDCLLCMEWYYTISVYILRYL